ncbi:hypothetical protein HY346_00620 [Candidatus Microgenomates bacterium]|nr:hypothetical protein [Candidatus Microgenomates bacterium]
MEEAYRDLILLNSHPAIKEVTPDALIVGPELDTPREDVPLTTTDNLWGQSIVTYWLTDWSTYLLTNYHAYINKYSIHNYSDDAAVAWLRVQQLRQEMQIIAIEAVKPIWTTEVNMYAPNSRSVNAIANYVCQIYHAENLDWERSFHFPVVGDESKAYYESDGLLRAHTAPIPYEIKALYTYFQGIVNGSYYCNRN